jgi:hypothetical protein
MFAIVRNVAVFFCLIGLLSKAQAADESYFVEFYTAQGARTNAARASHTFARFYEVENGQRSETVDISWLPAQGYFGRRNRMPVGSVPGTNYTVEQTLRLMSGRQVFRNGPYAISPELFEAAQGRKAELESGRIAYRFLGNDAYSVNSTHALSGVVGLLRRGVRRGTAATDSVIGYFLSMGEVWRPGGHPQAP